MSCVRPLTAYWRNAARSGITFDVVKSATKVPFKLPCGRCIGCRLEKARQWGLRCVHEAKLWKHNCYVTLTYSDEYLPLGHSLVREDVPRFMNMVRKCMEREVKLAPPVRFFAGGEYGEANKRPHYHLLLFNCYFPDMRLHTLNKRGEELYTSKMLSDCWFNMGHCTIGKLTFDSAVYCAKYALKKVNGDKAFEHYQVYDEDGVVYDRLPEFALMSRRPGIGAGYYEKFGDEVRNHDSVVIDGHEVRPPRFYDLRSERVNKPLLDLKKKKRKRLSVLNRLDNTEERLRVKERLMEIAAEKKERSL